MTETVLRVLIAGTGGFGVNECDAGQVVAAGDTMRGGAGAPLPMAEPALCAPALSLPRFAAPERRTSPAAARGAARMEAGMFSHG